MTSINTKSNLEKGGGIYMCNLWGTGKRMDGGQCNIHKVATEGNDHDEYDYQWVHIHESINGQH